MRADMSRLPAKWEKAASDLGLEIVSPFELVLASGTSIQVPVLLRRFGASKGMLLLSDFSLISDWTDEIDEAGYGFSVLSEPGITNAYVREDLIEVLRDWGWAGPPEDQPPWL